MELLEELVRIIVTVSNSMLFPVMIFLVLLIAYSFLMIGGTLSEYSRRCKDLEKKLKNGQLKMFNERMNELVRDHKGNDRLLDVELERLLKKIEYMLDGRLKTTRILIRLGPVLGLIGTLIPLGPALLGLSVGNIEKLADNLVIAFTSTVVGLLVGTISMVVFSIRKRWYTEDMDDLEYHAELLALKK
jgi:biopolymer transport protein ExbB/TolQ